VPPSGEGAEDIFVIYAFVGDGCLQEGVGQEMISRGEPTNLVEGSCY
jgi:transketolase